MSETLRFHSGNVPIRLWAQEAQTPASTRKPAILLLHGSGGHVDFWTSRLGQFFGQAGIHLYAPHYFDRTGTTRADLATITDGIHAPQWLSTVDDALRFIAARPDVDPHRIVVAGISLGAFLGLSFAAELSASPDPPARSRVRALLDISGGLPPPFDDRATAHMPPTLILHGAADPIVPVSSAHRLDALLTRLGVAHQTEILPGEGHWFSPAAFPRILLAVSSFLQTHLGR